MAQLPSCVSSRSSSSSPLPSADRAVLEQGALLGITGITAHRAISADGPLDRLTVLVHGAAGGVGAVATQLARRAGATVIGTTRRPEQLVQVRAMGAHHALLDGPDLAHAVRRIAPEGVDRIAEVDLSAHIEVDAEVIAVGVESPIVV